MTTIDTTKLGIGHFGRSGSSWRDQRHAKRMLLAGAAFVLGAFPQTVLAQAAAADEAGTSEIVVTATKRPELLSDVGMGVTVVSGADLEERQIRTFQDLTALVPGLAVQTSSPVITRLIIRGLNAGGSGSTVAVYVDDSPIGSSNALLQGSLLTSNLDTFDMASIEVLKGPQGTLYGANSQGGLIKFVTAAPDPGQFSGRAQAEVSTVSGGDVGYAARGVINAPLGENAAIRASGYYDRLPGFIDDTNLGIDDANSGRRYGARLSALANLTPDLTARLTGFYQRLQTRADPIVDVVGSPASYAMPVNVFRPVAGDLEQRRYLPSRRKQDFYNISASFDWDLGGVTASSVTSYSDVKNFQRRDAGSGVAGYLPPVTPEAPFGTPVSANFFLTNLVFGRPVLFRGTEEFRLKKVTQELRLSSDSEGMFNWQIGGFFTKEDTFSIQRQEFIDAATNTVITAAPGPGGDFMIDARYTEFAGFGELNFKLTPNFEISAGGRYSTNDQRALLGVTNGLLGIPAGLPPFTIKLNTDEDAFTFSVSPKFKINDNTLLYARYASGFRPGGPNLVPPNAPADYPTGYGSDSTRNYEIGLRSISASQAFTFDLAIFRIDWTDIQISTIVPLSVGQIAVTANGGKARSQGVELALGARPTEGLKFTLSGAYTDAELRQDAPGIGGLKGDDLAYVPDYTVTVDGEYDFALTGSTRAFGGFTLAYVGDRFTDFGTSILTTPHIKLPSYVTLGLRAGVDLGAFRVEAYARNLTNQRGILGYANAGGGVPVITGTKSIIQPRTIGVILTGNF